MKKPASHKFYLVTGFVVSGWLFFFPGIVKLPDDRIRQWDAVQIPARLIKPMYLLLELREWVRNKYKEK